MDERIETQRKQWQRPELTVLVRSKPEEAVLTACKYDTKTASTGSNVSYNGCGGYQSLPRTCTGATCSNNNPS